MATSAMAYLDPLVSRGQFAMIENRLLRSEHRRLREERRLVRELLKLQILESASLHAENRCVREEMINRRSVGPHGPLLSSQGFRHDLRGGAR